jgi:peptidoglycan/xylan/chitin deacetylase (PgdA/CDA1 family)
MKRTLLVAALLFSGSAMAEPQIAITFDDLPAHHVLPAGLSRIDVAHQIIDALKAGGIPPTYGFVNGVETIDEPASAPVLTLWHESGNLLGNHTWSHPGLSKLSVAAYEAEIVKNEPVIARAAGTSDWHWFRFPFIDEGKDETQRAAIRQFLSKRGYKIAAVTTGLNDWDYPPAYARCLAKNDTASITKLEAMCLTRAEQGFDYSRAMSASLYGRDIPYILLQHIGSFQAHILPKLIAMYKAKGVRFISLEQAAKDPANRAAVEPALPAPRRGLEAELTAKNLPVPPAPDSHTAELDAICK